MSVPLEYSIEWLTCAFASRLDVVLVSPNLRPCSLWVLLPKNSSVLVGAVVRAEPTLYAIAVGGTLM